MEWKWYAVLALSMNTNLEWCIVDILNYLIWFPINQVSEQHETANDVSIAAHCIIEYLMESCVAVEHNQFYGEAALFSV